MDIKHIKGALEDAIRGMHSNSGDNRESGYVEGIQYALHLLNRLNPTWHDAEKEMPDEEDEYLCLCNVSGKDVMRVLYLTISRDPYTGEVFKNWSSNEYFGVVMSWRNFSEV